MRHLGCFQPFTATINQSWDKYPHSVCHVHTCCFPLNKFLALGFSAQHSWKASNTYTILSSLKVVPVCLATSGIGIFPFQWACFWFWLCHILPVLFFSFATSSTAFMLRSPQGRSFMMIKGQFVCSSCFCNAMYSWKLYHKMVYTMGNRLSSCIPMVLFTYTNVIGFITRNKQMWRFRLPGGEV